MNEKKLDAKIQRDVENVKQDMGSLGGNVATRFGKAQDNFGDAADKAKADVTTWAEESASDLGEKIEHLTDDAKEKMSAVKKDVGHGLSQFNTKAQQMADKIPGDFGQQAASNPWVLISIALGLGFFLGTVLFRPTR